jgi:hypothetical protein
VGPASTPPRTPGGPGARRAASSPARVAMPRHAGCVLARLAPDPARRPRGGRRGPAWAIVVALAVLAGVSLTACETSYDKAKQLRAQAVAEAPKPLTIPKPNKEVKVGDTALIHDQNGDALVVELKNESKQALVNVPLLADVRDAKGKTVYKNDTAGLDFALNHVALMKPGETFYWVNDQIDEGGKTVKVTVGQPEAKAPTGALPELELSAPRSERDFSGPKVTGTVTDKSKLDQARLILFAVARQGGHIVAAGRGQIKALKVDAKPAPYVIYFIGNPVGADITIQAPPTVLK